MARDKYYRFGKRLTSNSLPQYVLQNLPSRFMAVTEDYNEQTHGTITDWAEVNKHHMMMTVILNHQKVSLKRKKTVN